MAVRQAGTRIVTGDAEIDALLMKLKIGAANRIARPSLIKAARHVLKSMKGNVPGKYKGIKHVLGMRADSKGGPTRKDPRVKVGAGVGKASKAEARRSGRNRRGVGISGRNIHWIIMGTGERQTGMKTDRKTGRKRLTGKPIRYTGKMPPILMNLIKDTAASEDAKVKSIIRTEAMERLNQLVGKK